MPGTWPTPPSIPLLQRLGGLTFRWELSRPGSQRCAKVERSDSASGYGSKQNHQGTAGFSLWFHLRILFAVRSSDPQRSCMKVRFSWCDPATAVDKLPDCEAATAMQLDAESATALQQRRCSNRAAATARCLNKCFSRNAATTIPQVLLPTQQLRFTCNSATAIKPTIYLFFAGLSSRDSAAILARFRNSASATFFWSQAMISTLAQ